MPLTLDLKASEDRFYGNWIRKGRAAFMRSDAYDILAAALRRYLRDEIPGQSFLIAGHRGAGKTALVSEVVEAVTDDIFEEWDVWAQQRAGGKSPSPPRERQRPLLVKLHGPSLVGMESTDPGGSSDGKAAEATPKIDAAGFRPGRRRVLAAPVVEVKIVTAAEPASKPASDKSTTPTGDRAQAALAQIMVGLYRALAREVGEAATVRALDAGDWKDRRHRLECAAQLRLELDRSAGPEELRDLWEEVEPKGCGILWPQGISEALVERLVPDQPLKEIVAVATAAQAFQVCSGAVSQNKTRKESATAERVSEVRSGFDAANAVNRVLALGIGGVIGYAIAGSAGAGIGLLGSLGATFLSRRSSRRERGEDYTFIIDRSVQSLERDLPLVIERVRAAGLAPVFVIDELDKLPHIGERSVRDAIAELINRFKQLTTDYGFFCFLTDRDYFDEVEQALAASVYPAEHTFFSERLLIGYGPRDFDGYAASVLTADGAPEDAFARHVLCKRLIFDSKLNTIEFRRRLRRGWGDADGKQIYRTPSEKLAGSTSNLIAVAIQLAIEQVLGHEIFAARIEQDSELRLMAFDVLYRVSRLWERDSRTIDVGRAEIALDLVGRRGGDIPDRDEAENVVVAQIGAADFDLLVRMVEMLIGLLCNFSSLSIVFAASPGPASSEIGFNRVVFASLEARHIRRLLQKEGDTTRFKFLFWRDGTDLYSNVEAAKLQNRANLSLLWLEAFDDLGIPLGDLRGLGVSPTVSENSVADAIALVTRCLEAGNLAEAQSALAPLDEFVKALRDHRAEIGGAVSLAADILRETRPESNARNLSGIIAGMLRHLPVGWLRQRPLAATIGPMSADDVSEPVELPVDDPARIEAWSEEIQSRAFSPAKAGLDARAERAWNWWLGGLRPDGADLDYGGPEQPQFNDLVLAAAGRLPSRLLDQDVRAIDKFAWSELALAGVASQWRLVADRSERVPLWAPFAALRALGFGRDCLEELLAHPAQDGALPHARGQAASFLPEIRESKPGVLVVARDALETPPGIPYILVSPETAETYRVEIMGLKDAGVIKAGLYQA